MVFGAWMMTLAAASDGPACDPVAAPVGDAAAVLVRIDGDLEIRAAEGDQVSVEACGVDARVRRRGAALELTARDPASRVVVNVPSAIGTVTVHGHEGRVSASVPARLAIVSSRGAVEVRQASALRVAYHEGDVVVHELPGDLAADHVTGTITGTVRGEVQAEAVSGGVQVTRTPAGPVSLR